MDFELAVDREMQGQFPHPYLSAATRKAYTRSGRPLTLDLNNWRELEEGQRSIRVSEKLDHLLQLIAQWSGTPGRGWKIQVTVDYPLIAADNPAELASYLVHLEKSDLLRQAAKAVDGTVYELTIPGWENVEPMPVLGGLPSRCLSQCRLIRPSILRIESGSSRQFWIADSIRSA